MTRILIALLSLAFLGTGGLVAAVDGFGSAEPVSSITLPGAATASTSTGTTVAGTTTTGTTTDTTTEAIVMTTGAAADLSGPCDEAEHADHTGDNSGRGSRHDSRGDHGSDDRGGDDRHHSGRGSDDDGNDD